MADKEAARKMEGIPISKEFIDSFKNEGDTGEFSNAEDSSFKQLNESVKWILKSIDNALSQSDERYATKPATLDLYGELSVLVAKRNISEDMLKNSPEFFWGTITIGLLTEKFITYSQIKKEKTQAKPKKEGAKNG